MIVFLGLLGIAATVMTAGIESQRSQGLDMVEESKSGNRAQARAIEEAESWSPPPDQFCTMVLTDAVHTETGAKYTFPSGCLSPGWEPMN